MQVQPLKFVFYLNYFLLCCNCIRCIAIINCLNLKQNNAKKMNGRKLVSCSDYPDVFLFDNLMIYRPISSRTNENLVAVKIYFSQTIIQQHLFSSLQVRLNRHPLTFYTEIQSSKIYLSYTLFFLLEMKQQLHGFSMKKKQIF